MNPTTNDISRALQEIETADLPEDHPRAIARRKVKEWRSDAQRQRLPVVNVTDDKGGRRLDTDTVLKWQPGHLGRLK